jgi:hypothetical protein
MATKIPISRMFALLLSMIFLLMGTLPIQTAAAKTEVAAPLSAPGAFNKYFPVNGAVNAPYNVQMLTWYPSSGANSYKYCIDTVNNNSCDTGWTFSASGGAYAFVVLLLNPSTTYYWHVRATDGTITYSDGDVWWSFTTGSGQSDLSLFNAKPTGSTIYANDPFQAYVRVTNSGPIDTYFPYAEFYLDRVPVGCGDYGDASYYWENIPAGTDAYYYANFGNLSLGAHYVYIGIDTGDCWISETNETNNLTGQINFTVIAPPAAAPANDNFNNATHIGSRLYTDSIDTRGATIDYINDPFVSTVNCYGYNKASVWYRYTPTSNQTIQFNTFGSDYDTVLSVWTGTLGNLTLTGCNDDSGGLQSGLTLNLSAGITYYVEVNDFFADSDFYATSLEVASTSSARQLGMDKSNVPASLTKAPADLNAQAGGALQFNVLPITFADVAPVNQYWRDIEILYANGLTAGCSVTPLNFCPATILDRAQSAVFNLRGNYGTGYVPPAAPWNLFADDWSAGAWAEKWAEGMYNAGLTAGCVASPLQYCPWDQTPRVQAAVFGVRLMHGNSYVPPAATGNVFFDMTDTAFYGTKWAEQAYADGLLPNCGTDIGSGKPLFCPNDLVSRGLGAYMIVRAKSLTMP